MDLNQLFNQVMPAAVPMTSILDFLTLLLAAVFLGILLFDAYKRYFKKDEYFDMSLARSLIILTPALFTMFYLMKTSPTLSIGLLGSLAMIRFRTSVKRMEDAAFIFLAVAVAISTSLSLPLLGLILILGMYVFGFSRRMQWLKGTTSQQALFTVNLPTNVKPSSVIEDILKRSVQAEIVSVRTFDGITSIVFRTMNLDYKSNFTLQQTIHELDPKIQINVFYPDSNLSNSTL